MEFLNASSFFIVLYITDFGFGFQVLWSRVFLVSGFRSAGYSFSSSTWS